MAVDVFFAQSIARVLAAIEAAFEAAHYASGEANEEYQRGVQDAILAIAKAFGVDEQGAKGR